MKTGEKKEHETEETKRQNTWGETFGSEIRGDEKEARKKQQVGPREPESRGERGAKEGEQGRRAGRGRGGEKSDVEGSGPGVRGLVYQM